MKKIIAALALVTLFSFKANEEKKYTLTFTADQLNALGYVIDNTTAPHNMVKGVQELINKQLQSQVDTTKRK